MEDIFDIFCSIGNLKFISIFGTASFFVQKIENLAQTAPYLVEACNKNNNDLRQSPICNYEVVFGSDFDNKSFLAFHESYEVAALNAFSEGLNNQNGKIKKNS